MERTDKTCNAAYDDSHIMTSHIILFTCYTLYHNLDKPEYDQDKAIGCTIAIKQR